MEEIREYDAKITKKNEKKATERHKQLANFIKKIHTQLREDSDAYGAEKAWKMHITQDEKLKEYAESMYQLATQHWGQNSWSTETSTFCRVEWIKCKCKDYFFNGGIENYDDKEKSLMEKIIQESCQAENVYNFDNDAKTKIKILDVGSCYNPFATEDTFIVTAVDIAPYSNDVLKCDFLNLSVENEKMFSDDNTLIGLPKNSYDAVIFSLLLEYIPCPEKRFLCCKKAYDLLRNRGILFIATPDSKHQGSNAKIINTSWKVVLAKLGFMRISYEKLRHLHCMVFRKCIYNEAAMKKINWKKITEDDELHSAKKIFIPQDFQSKIANDDFERNVQQSTHNDEELLTLFSELPCET